MCRQSRFNYHLVAPTHPHFKYMLKVSTGYNGCNSQSAEVWYIELKNRLFFSITGYVKKIKLFSMRVHVKYAWFFPLSIDLHNLRWYYKTQSWNNTYLHWIPLTNYVIYNVTNNVNRIFLRWQSLCNHIEIFQVELKYNTISFHSIIWQLHNPKEVSHRRLNATFIIHRSPQSHHVSEAYGLILCIFIY